MLPSNVTRCAGFLPQTQHDRCPRRPECARFRNNDTAIDMAWSACEGGDSFVQHVESIGDEAGKRHPKAATPDRTTAMCGAARTEGGA